MNFSSSLTNIAEALCNVQAEIKNPIKNQTNKGVMGAPKYANLEDTLQEYVRPVLAKYGMSFFQSVKSDENGRVGVCTVLLHQSGEFIQGDYVFCDVKIPISKEGKEILTQGQATGVCVTYLRRYSLNSALGINGDKDTDGSFEEVPDNSNNAKPDYTPKNAPQTAKTTAAAEKPNDTTSGGATTSMTYNEAKSMVLTFGKYANKTLLEVYNEDDSYLTWVENNERTNPKIKEAIAIVKAMNDQAAVPEDDDGLPF